MSFGSDSFNANGQDARNNYLVDGASNNDDVVGQRAGTQARTPIESVQEFQVLTSQYDAELGRTSGDVINAVTKQGGNKFRGSPFYFLEDASMTGKDYPFRVLARPQRLAFARVGAEAGRSSNLHSRVTRVMASPHAVGSKSSVAVRTRRLAATRRRNSSGLSGTASNHSGGRSSNRNSTGSRARSPIRTPTRMVSRALVLLPEAPSAAGRRPRFKARAARPSAQSTVNRGVPETVPKRAPKSGASVRRSCDV